ncbi:MAG TPA: NDP-sugar synthase [Syntrophomonadaceae bacterium]|jgi:mannose-1-phosphate guanylyltransferase|nr:NDP-sugar synthase [Syntrophomonadaceae bacterium]
MKGMIMAAGVGSRLMPLTSDIPKPMVPMVNRPLMENTVHLLYEHGFHDLIANLHYHASVISDYFGDGSGYGVRMEFSLEEELMGTAGGVKRCEWFLDESFVVVSGDALTDINLRALMDAHKKNGALATIALKEVDEVEQFGVVVTDAEGRIKRFQEKPRAEEALSHTANTGIYVFEPEIFRYIPADQFYDFGKQVFPALVKMGAPFYGVEVDGYWCDVGSLETYRQAHIDCLQGNVRLCNPKTIPGKREGNVLLGSGVQIGNNVDLRGYVALGPGVVLEDDVSIEDSVIWERALIGKGSRLSNSVVGSHTVIKEESRLDAGAVIASYCTLEPSSHIPADARVFRSVEGDLQVEHG